MLITLSSGQQREYPDGTTGMEIAKSISAEFAQKVIGIFVNGKKYDLSRKINEDGIVRFITFDDDEGKEIFWHSSAHLMAEAVKSLYPGTKFGVGPAIEQGFYYDMELPEGINLTSEDIPKIESKMKELAQRDGQFQRFEISWDEAVEYFKKEGDPYKLEILEGLKDEEITLYKQGNFTDLCRGTHIPDTKLIKAIKLLNIAGAYWRGDSNNKMLTRIYGITFPEQSMLDEFLKMREEAEKRDHRKLGKELDIFMISPAIGPGLPVWLPNGTFIRRKLENFLKDEMLRRGYVEVITPHIGNLNLYKTSGHYPYYSDSQFPPMKVEDEEYLLKPMNCPHHHQIYASKPRSYRDLPIRLAEFGTVYRYEQSGELTGLTRVRGFTQDDAHIYCTHEQLKDEIKSTVELTQLVFKTFDMEVTTRLSFRDENSEKWAGDLEIWEKAQKELKEVADEMGLNYTTGIGEASFYGPKIDFIVKDAIGRKWQLGTVQVDYVMPERFELEYTDADNQKKRPVIIHRAPFGSMERFMSILIEHYAGNFPVWIAPIQAMILPISDKQIEYAKKLEDEFTQAGYRVQIDNRSEKINRKIADAETKKIQIQFIVGQKEVDSESISLRIHGKGDLGKKSIEEVMELLAKLNVPGSSIEKVLG
ncbi:MAG TPA: threonine--tRNA ligase [Candidatus Kapabacteria bacterium]|jgi:threonyl-tRNA synthetase|nr:threonine--tRNA ligase [Candidatus Kapabacteria bacterium]HOV92315.1 threonine--tRNA ligase [Candidatus Kapabacteria bacterium]